MERIELIHVNKKLGGKEVLKGVDLTLEEGKLYGIIGENGSGKTTLMNMLSGIYYPDCGTIYVDGKPAVIRSPKDAYNYKIGMVHQHFKLIDVFTALENIVLGIKPEQNFFQRIFTKKNKRLINKASKKYARKAVKEICEKYGFKLDLDKKVFDMSVSEKQTLEIIKVLYRGADVLILDEPTAALDPFAEAEVYSSFNEIVGDRTAVYISHRLSSCRFCDEIVVFDQGRIVQQGTHEELVEQTNCKYCELWSAQAKYYA